MRFLHCLAGLVLVVAGCGPSVGRPAGKVVLKGQGVGGADVKLVAVHDPKLEFFGTTRDDGTYLVSYREYSGIPVGTYRVTITRYTLPNGRPLPPGEAGEEWKANDKVVKRAYTFEKEIPSGASALDFDLAQGKPVSVE